MCVSSQALLPLDYAAGQGRVIGRRDARTILWRTTSSARTGPGRGRLPLPCQRVGRPSCGRSRSGALQIRGLDLAPAGERSRLPSPARRPSRQLGPMDGRLHKHVCTPGTSFWKAPPVSSRWSRVQRQSCARWCRAPGVTGSGSGRSSGARGTLSGRPISRNLKARAGASSTSGAPPHRHHLERPTRSCFVEEVDCERNSVLRIVNATCRRIEINSMPSGLRIAHLEPS